ncbi:bifunctional 2-polyprenyl-6-hydroxyphenol methylase/3-demethylubiquinol 3-O-methyltransferase UbiG [Novosphingobium sp. AP12]|uniref:class I SAM-dependent methyltransferase n=1 Tax=Novosphingobium sp. AP12 TaxID=1144305 RepID=UPI00027214E8|nr:class I SAM-dependent methyltransferase [Novosphingobium sp. AP12]EJL28343.1 methyltransferase family protein [Novosphingobium sp. AP12]
MRDWQKSVLLSGGPRKSQAIHFDQSHLAAFRDFRPTLSELIAAYPEARLLELGGGRKPSFSLSELPGNIASYTVNDIDPSELARTADEYDKACFDVTGDVSEFEGQFDVIFSRTLIEHVKDGVQMHRNVMKLLRPGGVAFHMAPTLYAVPFVINKYLPETLSTGLLYALAPKRRHNRNKFPAHYSWCYGDRRKMQAMLEGVGLRSIRIRTFYGHAYFEKIPLLRQVDRALSNLAADRDWSALGSYAHITAYKPLT